jgi:hypothetical protein
MQLAYTHMYGYNPQRRTGEEGMAADFIIVKR